MIHASDDDLAQPFRETLPVRRLPGWGWLVPALPLAVSASWWFGGDTVGRRLVAALPAALSTVLTVVCLRGIGRQRDARVEVGAGSILIDGESVLPPKPHVVLVAPRGDGQFVLAWRRSWAVDVEVSLPSREAGTEILRRLGQEVATRPVVVRTATQRRSEWVNHAHIVFMLAIASWLGVHALAPPGSPPGWSMGIWVVAAVAFAVAFACDHAPLFGTLRIDATGLVARTWFDVEIIPLGDIVGVELHTEPRGRGQHDAFVIFALRSGRYRRFRTGIGEGARRRAGAVAAHATFLLRHPAG